MKKITAIMLVALLLSGCGGKSANPIQVKDSDDIVLTCLDIEDEMGQLDRKARKLTGDSDKTGKNLALGIAGGFFLVPWFFMDFSDAERIEAEAMIDRHNHLKKVARKKGCDII